MAKKKPVKKGPKKTTPKKRPSAKARASRRPVEVPEFRLDLTHNPDRYNQYHKKGARLNYALFLVMLTIFNFLIFLALVPLMMFIRSNILLLILGGLGLVFGMVYLYLIRDIEHLKPRHHLFAAFYIPWLAIINIMVLSFVGNLIQYWGGYEYPFIAYASAVYVVMFLLPYALALIFERLWPKRKDVI